MDVILGMYVLMGLAIAMTLWASMPAKNSNVKIFAAAIILWPAVLYVAWKTRKENDK